VLGCPGGGKLRSRLLNVSSGKVSDLRRELPKINRNIQFRASNNYRACKAVVKQARHPDSAYPKN